MSCSGSGLLQAVIDGTREIVVACDPQLRVTAFNRAFARVCEKIYGAQVSVGQDLAEVYATVPGDHDRVVGLWRRSLEGEEFVTVVELGDPARERNAYQITSSSIRDAQGRLLGAAHLVHDVTERLRTEEQLRRSRRELEMVNGQLQLANERLARELAERRRAEEALLESERRFAAVVASAPVVLIATDAQGVCTLWEGRALRAIGWNPEGLVGRSLLEEEGCSQHLAPSVRRALAGEEFTEFVSAHGRHFEARYAPLRGDGDQVRGVVVVALDVSEARLAAETIFQQAELLQTLLDAIPAMICFFDRSGEVLKVNRELQRVLGWSFEELSRDGMGQLCYPDPDYRRAAVSHMLRAAPGWSDWEAVTRSGGKVTVSWAHVRLTDGTYVGIGIDQTDRTRSEAEKRRLEEQLRQAQKMEAIGRLAGGVAHDFNNLLTVILACAEHGLRKSAASDPLHRSFEQIRKAGRRASSLTGQLLAFSRRQVLRPTVLDLNAVVGEVCEMLRRTIAEDVDLLVERGAAIGGIRADRTQVEQILMNLAVNARDAMPNGGLLSISTHEESLDAEEALRHEVKPGRYVCLSVSDTGVGMDEETLGHLFEPFFTTKPLGEGTGLGLATVYGIAKQSEGLVRVRSAPGQGSRFEVLLPRSDEAPAVAGTPPPGCVAKRGTTGAVVLLLEDMHELRDLLAAELREQGYEVLPASRGEEALRVAELCGRPIDLLVTDVVMPGMPGKEVFARLSARNERLRVLYMSGHAHDQLAQHGVLEPGIAFLQKPFAPQALAAKVLEILSSPASGPSAALPRAS